MLTCGMHATVDGCQERCTDAQFKIQTSQEYDGKKLVSCTKEGLKFEETEDEKKAREELASSFEPLCRVIKDILGDKVRNFEC